MNSFRRSGAHGDCENKKWEVIAVYLKMYRNPREEHKNCENIMECGRMWHAIYI